jgi:hypothetical protein
MTLSISHLLSFPVVFFLVLKMENNLTTKPAGLRRFLLKLSYYSY